MLPQVEHLVLKKAPLKLVVGQVRFPVLPGFGEQGFISPFHRLIKDAYPLSDRIHKAGFQITPSGLKATPNEVLWRFTTRDKAWAIVVGEGAVTLEAQQYSSKDEFLDRFKVMLCSAKEAFELTERLRLGLRYVNEIRYPGAETVSQWRDLLRSEFVGFDASTVLGGSVEHMFQELRVHREDGVLAVRHGLVPVPSGETGLAEPLTGERLYLIDLDYYNNIECEFDVNDTIGTIRSYNDVLYRFFRWTLDEKLFHYLEPSHDA